MVNTIVEAILINRESSVVFSPRDNDGFRQCPLCERQHYGDNPPYQCIHCLVIWEEKFIESGEEKKPPTEKINHPQHYGGDTTYEAIKVIEAWDLNFCLGNTVKYIARAGKKDDYLDDLQKAAWYLNREIEFRKKIRSALNAVEDRQ